MAVYSGLCLMILLAPPQARVADTAARAPALGKSAAASAHAPPPAETLEFAWQAALAADRRLEGEQYSASAAYEQLQAVKARRWTRVDLEASYTARSDEPRFRLHLPGVPLSNDLTPLMQDENFAARAAFEMPLYTSGRISHTIDAASSEALAAALQYEDATVDVKMEVAEVFVGVLRAQRELAVRETAVRNLDSYFCDVAQRFQHQQVPKHDLLRAQVALADARQGAIEARNALDIARAAYNRYLGRPLTYPVRLAEAPWSAPGESVDELTAAARGNRRQLARLDAETRALRHQAESLRASNRPQVHLRGEYSFEENRYREPEGIAALGVGVSWNVFDSGSTRHEAASLAHRAESLLRLKADLLSRIELDVRRRWLDVQQAQRRLEVTPQAIDQAEENLRVVRKRYFLGTATNTEVLDAETLRTRAYRNHHHAAYDAVLAVLRLRHATGRL